MKKLKIPTRLGREFKTVKAILKSQGETRGLDALILSWVKYEKQFRRLFSYLVYQHDYVTSDERVVIDKAICTNDWLYPYSLIPQIEKLGGVLISDLVGAHHEKLVGEIERIGTYRDKIMHGQLSGEDIPRKQLIADAQIVVDWMNLLADGAEQAHGYDGIEPKTYDLAQSREKLGSVGHRFDTIAELKAWIAEINNPKNRRRKA